ncbi:hypothetical protein Tco_0595598 [Tanacetum coccineum]
MNSGVGRSAGIRLWEHTMMRPDHQDPNALDNMKPMKRYCFHKFTMSSCYGKDVTKMQIIGYKLDWHYCFLDTFYRLVSLRLGFALTEWVVDGEIDDYELHTKKIIKFRLGGRDNSLTLLEFALRLGLYHADEIEEDGFIVYIEGGQYREVYDKIQKNDLWLLSMFDARHQNGYANVAWGVDKGCGEELKCFDLLPSRESMQDLYDRMDRMEIRQEAIKRMEYRMSNHWDRGDVGVEMKVVFEDGYGDGVERVTVVSAVVMRWRWREGWQPRYGGAWRMMVMIKMVAVEMG